MTFSHQQFGQDVWDIFAKSQVVEHQRDALHGVHEATIRHHMPESMATGVCRRQKIRVAVLAH